MTNIPLRPANVNFYGGFLTTTGYQFLNFTTDLKPQIDAMKALGLNLVVFFGDVQCVSNGMTLAAYLALRKQIHDYCLKIGMYTLCYEAITWVLWTPSNTYSTSNPTFPTWADATTIIAAGAQLAGLYSNTVGIVALDEPFNGVDATFSGLVTNLTNVRNAIKAVIPSDIGVCGCPNSSGNGASPVFDYSGSGGGSTAFNVDSVASICDFFAYHPFATASLAQSSALRGAYPDKQILMPSSISVSNGSGGIAALVNSIWGLVSQPTFPLVGYFITLDYPLFSPANTLGMLDGGTYAPRTAKTVPVQANIVQPLAQRPVRKFAGHPRLNQYFNSSYGA